MVGCQITALSWGSGSPFVRFSSFFSDFSSSVFLCSLSFLGLLSCCDSSGFGVFCARIGLAGPKSRIAKQIKEMGYIFRTGRLTGPKRPNNLGDRFFTGVLERRLLSAL